jgi:hypothetical protein
VLKSGLSQTPYFDLASASNFWFGASTGGNNSILYRFGWTGSGSVTTTFTNAPFVATFVGDTTNVTGTSNTGYINEYLPGTLAGAFGETYALSDYWVGIQPASNPGQSLLFGDSSSYAGILDMYAKDSALTAYDLMSSIGPINSDAVLKSGLSQTPYFDLASASNFWFEAVRPNSSSVPEPSTMLLLGSGVIGLVAYGRKKFFNKS